MAITFTLLVAASSNLDFWIRLDEAVRVVGSESRCRVLFKSYGQKTNVASERSERATLHLKWRVVFKGWSENQVNLYLILKRIWCLFEWCID